MSYVDEVQRSTLITKVSKWKTFDDRHGPHVAGKPARLVSCAVINRSEGNKICDPFDINPEDNPADIVAALLETGQTIANGDRSSTAVSAVFFFVSNDANRTPVKSGAAPWAREFPMTFDPVGGRDSEFSSRNDLRRKDNQDASVVARYLEATGKTLDSNEQVIRALGLTLGAVLDDARAERAQNATTQNQMLGQVLTMFQALMTAENNKVERDIRATIAMANLEDSRGWKKVQQDLAAQCVPQVAGIVGLGATALAQYAQKAMGAEVTPLQVRLLDALKPIVGKPEVLAEVIAGLPENEQAKIVEIMPELNKLSNVVEMTQKKPAASVGGGGSGFSLAKFKTLPGVKAVYERRQIAQASVAGTGAGK